MANDELELVKSAVDLASHPGGEMLVRLGRRTIRIPEGAQEKLLDVLHHLASGHDVAVVPVYAELTTQQAADLLGVSRPHLVTLLEAGEMPFRRIGRHRRVRADDLLAYQERRRRERRALLAELTQEAQEMGLGY